MDHLRYVFSFVNGRREQFDFDFDENFGLIQSFCRDLPEWARLETHQCRNCPLAPAEHPYCPLATALIEPVTRLVDVVSYESVRVEVVSRERSITQETTAQEAISAVLGLLNATSGCPLTDYFRPMARFHLPFANQAETLYRAAGTYLLGEYFRARSGEPAEIALDGLTRIYRDLEQVNRGIIARIRTLHPQDGALNALVQLDLYAKSLPFAIEDSLAGLRPFFAAYLR